MATQDVTSKEAPLGEARGLDLPVTTVTLTEDRARVVRRGRTELPAGHTVLRTAAVSPFVADKTLAARVVPPEGGARVVEARVVREVRQVPAGEDVEDPAVLRDQLAELERRHEQVAKLHYLAADEPETLDAAEQLALAELIEDVAWGRADLEAWGQRLDRLRRARQEAQDELADLDERLERLSREKAALEARQRASGRVDETVAAHLEVRLDAEAASEVELEVEYVVPGACWSPYHTATLSGSRVTVRSDACVWQRTEEDWEEVELRFSTARASLGAEPPRLESDVLRAQKKPEQVEVQVREQAIQTTGLGAAAAAPPRDDVRLPGVDDGGETLELSATTAATVRCDGRPRRVEVLRFEAEAERSRVLTPERAPCAFLQTIQANTGSVPLLAGPVDLIRHSGLVGRTSTDFAAPGERFRLGWGPDAEVRVSRELEETEPESGVLSSWVAHDRKVTVRIGNLGAETRQLRVTERVPVSEVEQVEIRPDVERTTGGKRPDEDGMVVWEVSLPPAGRETLSLRYTLRKHKDVAGV